MNEAVLVGAGLGLSFLSVAVGAWHFCHVDKKIRLRGLLWFACGAIAQAVMDWLAGQPQVAISNTVMAAVLLYIWWTKGGGDGFKKAWKKATERLAFLAPVAQPA